MVMPVLNTASFLPEAIDSILGQTLGDLELIVVDDGSSDASREIAQAYAGRDSRVRCIALERDTSNLSGARASNAGVAAARGDVIARMDSDDLAAPDRLAVQLAFMRAHKLAICGGRATTFGETSKPVWHPLSRDGIRNELVFRSAAMNSTLMIEAALIREARYSETDAFEQYELQTRIYFLGAWQNTPQVVHRFREHPASATRVFHSQKADSNWQLRFRYFFRLFPDATLDDFRAIHMVARTIAIAEPTQLETAARWLTLLSRVAEDEVRANMLRRWDLTCTAAVGAAAACAAALQAEIAEQIMAVPA